MEEIRQKYSPQESGWYIGLKNDDEPFVFYVKELGEKYQIFLPWEFVGNPNLKFVFDTKSWEIVQLDPQEKKITNWTTLKNIKPLKYSIMSNTELEMAYRESLVGSNIKIDETEYTILYTSHHIHSWTIYNIENVETKKIRQVQLQGFDEWSFSGIDKIEVEILKN